MITSQKTAQGVIAAGHQATAQAAIEVMQEGGNAFDAALAATFASCVAEPVLSSLGGGGFLLAKPAHGSPVLYDFFSQTPRRRVPAAETDFYPILANFGNAQQEFHIGLGSIATPGLVAGLFRIHRELCRMPLAAIVQPACELARTGVVVNGFQAYIARIVEPILRSSTAALSLHCSAGSPSRLAGEGERVRQPDIANALEALTREGETLFYRGDIGKQLVQACVVQGGHLRDEDLAGYRVVVRQPLRTGYRNAVLTTNPAPSLGGTLIAFTLALLEAAPFSQDAFGTELHIRLLARAMGITQGLRRERLGDGPRSPRWAESVLHPELLQQYRDTLLRHPVCSRGTTQISVADSEGNLASMTVSNGEGSGYVIPGTGIMVNNMLGEEDIHPHGFANWPTDQRIASMMAPTLLCTAAGNEIALGSGGSNRIRSAILQVISNLVDFALPLEQAVAAPRVHFESGLLNLEPPREPQALHMLEGEFPSQKLWDERNLFFGGTHSVERGGEGTLRGSGDPRRGGVCLLYRP